MKFWKCLRWIATALFLVFLLGSWFGSDPATSQPGSANPVPRAAPIF